MHNLDAFLISIVQLMVLPGFLVGACWQWLRPMLGGAAIGANSLATSAILGAIGGIAGSMALAGLVAALKIEAWRGHALIYVAGSVLGAAIMLVAVERLRV
jgi:hypothetical protein